MRVIFALLCLFQFCIAHAQQAEINNNLPQLLGNVHSIYQRGDTLLVGGDFTNAYLNDSLIRFGGAIDTGSQVIQYPWACPDGPVTSVISDQQGGFIIAGTFNKFGDSLRSNIARLDSNGKVTSTFSNIAVSGTIKRMQLIDDTLYIAGGFKGVDNPVNLKKGSTGMLRADTTYTGILDPASNLSAAAPDDQGGWFIAGDFNSALKLKQPSLKWIDSTGTEYNWHVRTNGQIYSILKIGDSLLIGGAFTQVNGVSRNHLALVRISTREVLPWDPSPNGDVNTIVSYMNRIFIGGAFNQVGDSLRGNGASFDSIGQITQWNPMAQGPIRCMVPYQQKMIVGGAFFTLRNALVRKQLGSVDIDSGYATSWNPVTLASNNGNTINALLIVGSNLYAGSDFFELLNPGPGNSLRVFNLLTGVEKSWNIQVRGPVYSLQYWQGKILFGGSFTQVNNQLFKNLALLDTNGILAPFSWSAESTVHLIVSHGNNTIISGAFKSFTQSSQSYFAAIRLSTSSLIQFNFAINDEVKAFVKVDTLIYLGGAFTRVNNQVRNKFAEISLLTQVPTTLVKNFDANIECMVARDSVLLIGGWFYSVNDSVRKNVAAINRISQNITSWNPSADYVVEDMVVSGDDLFIGGSFSKVGNRQRNGLAKVSCLTGALSEWLPTGDFRGTYRLILVGNNLLNGGINPICFDTGTAAQRTLNLNYWINNYLGQFGIVPAISGNRLYLGGYFEGMRNWDSPKHGGLIAIRAGSGKMLPFDFQVNGPVYDLKASYNDKNRIFMAGGFSSAQGNIRWYGADLHLLSGFIGLWRPSLTSPVYALSPVFNRIYLGKMGALTFVDQADNGNGSEYTFSGFGDVNARIQLANGKVYVAANAGGFSKLKVIDINSLQTVKSYNLNGEIRAFNLQDSILYIGGEFTNIAGISRSYCAALNVVSDSILPVLSNVIVNDAVNSIAIDGARLYLAGNFTYVNGYKRKGLALVDRINGKLYNWTADANGTVQYVHAAANGVFVSGAFSEVRNIKRKGLAFLSGSHAGMVSLTSPSLHQSNVPLTAVLAWTSAPGSGIQYQYELDSSSLFNSPLKKSGIITQTSVQLSFRFKTKYYWRVRLIQVETDSQLIAINDTSDWSPVYDFTTLSYPALALPVSGTLLNIDSSFFQTQPISGVAGVQMRIDTTVGHTIALFGMTPLLQTFYATTGSLVPGKQYNIAVRGYNAQDTSQWNTYVFTVNSGIVLISPVDLSDSTPVAMNFSFSNGFVKQVQSVLLIDTSASFDSPLLIKKTATTNSVLQKELRFNQRYFWKVIVIKGPDTPGVSVVRSFTTDSYLLKPLKPSMDETLVKVVPTYITWKHIDGPVYINYQVDTGSQFGNPINRVVISEAGFDSLVGLLPQQAYYIRMRRFHITDTTDWGEVVRFTTDSKFVPTPVLLTPLNGSIHLVTDTIRLVWKAMSGINGYILQVGLDTNVSNTFFSINPSDTVLDWKPVVTDKIYYWRVKAVMPGKESVWSALGNFKVETDFPVPQILHPDNNQTVARHLVLSWDSLSGITQYQYQIAKQVSPSTEPIIAVTRPRSDSILLDVNSTYYWRVRSVLNGRLSGWSHVAILNTLTSGLSSLAKREEFILYPNPVGNTLYLHNAGSGVDQLVIYDLFQHKLLEIAPVGKPDEVDVSMLPSGIYLIQVRNANGVLVGRFVKE